MGLQALLLSWAITNREKPRAKHCFFQKHSSSLAQSCFTETWPCRRRKIQEVFSFIPSRGEKSIGVSLFLFRARIDEHQSDFLKDSLKPHKKEVYQVTCCHCLKYCSPTHTSHMNNKNREVLGRC